VPETQALEFENRSYWGRRDASRREEKTGRTIKLARREAGKAAHQRADGSYLILAGKLSVAKSRWKQERG